MHYEPHFSSISAMFSLKLPCAVVITLSKNLLKLNLSLANEVVQCDTIAIPDQNIEFPKTFNQRKHELLLECGIFTTICACSGAVLVVSIFKTDIWVLPRNPFRISQFVTTNNSDFKKLALNSRNRHEGIVRRQR